MYVPLKTLLALKKKEREEEEKKKKEKVKKIGEAAHR